jgi:Ricin-type beta-trefoil lectin domain
MLKRVLAGAAVAAVSLMPAATAAQASAAQASTAQAARPAPHAAVVSLHRTYLAHLGHTKPAKIGGIMYARGRAPKAARTGAACSEPNCPLIYHGGAVQRSPHVYLLLWGPHWSSDPSQAASASYLESFYAGLGVQPKDSWSTINSLYGEGSGFPTFAGSVYEGAFQDTSTPPTGLGQGQLAAEADAFASARGITDLTDAQIVVATQSGTCPNGFFSPGCAGGTGNYCAWHSNSSEPYTNLPYILDAGSGCGADILRSQYDGFSIVGGHEYAETVTDPFPVSGWWDGSDPFGGEIGDKCAWSDPVTHNVDIAAVTLSTGTFAMQPLYDNNALVNGGDGCVMKPIGAVTGFRNLCLDDKAGASSNGNPVDIWQCTGGSRQRWTQQNGELQVVGKCLTDSTGGGSGTKLVIETCTGQRNQRWTRNWAGEYWLSSVGLCLTDPAGSTTNGTQVQVQNCANTPAQRWSVP